MHYGYIIKRCTYFRVSSLTLIAPKVVITTVTSMVAVGLVVQLVPVVVSMVAVVGLVVQLVPVVVVSMVAVDLVVQLAPVVVVIPELVLKIMTILE
jgi:hypothetical protein